MKTPRAHQQQAIDSIDTSLDRQQIIMACGTGKTLVGMHVAQKFIADHDSATVVVTVPTLGLLEQTYRAWRADAPFSFDAIAICSQDIGDINNEDISLDELSMTTTTNAGELAKFLSSTSGVRVIFSTYQSSPVLGNTQRRFDVPAFDVAIVDEAHRTAGDSKSAFTSILTDTSIRVTKRVFMTATPKVVSSKSDDISRVIMSMDDESVYGERRYELSVRDAVNAGLLSDFKLLVVGVTDREVDQYFEQYGEAAENIAAAAALNRAIDDYGLSSSLVYFNTIVASDAFARTMQRVAGAGVECYHVDGTIPLADRLDVLDKIESTNKTTVISNSRCLSEGIDVPTLDSVMFADARSSDVDIVQCIGRAIRKNPHGDKEAKIILNVRVHENEDVEQIIDSGEFKKIRQIISGLESHDSELASVLRNFPRGENRERDYLDNWIEYRLPNDLEIIVWENFRKAFSSVILGESDIFGRRVREVMRYTSQYGVLPEEHGSLLAEWVRSQRRRRGDLPSWKIKILESIPGWSWETIGKTKHDNHFIKMASLVAEEKEKTGKFPLSNTKMGKWISHQRDLKNSMPEERKEILELIPEWTWSMKEEYYNLMFQLTKQFIEKYGFCPRKEDEFNGEKVGQWVVTQRINMKNKTLSDQKVQMFNSIPEWEWDGLLARWKINLHKIIHFVEDNDRFPKKSTSSEKSLAAWTAKQRKLYKDRKLSQEKIELLESKVPHWHW